MYGWSIYAGETVRFKLKHCVADTKKSVRVDTQTMSNAVIDNASGRDSEPNILEMFFQQNLDGATL